MASDTQLRLVKNVLVRDYDALWAAHELGQHRDPIPGRLPPLHVAALLGDMRSIQPLISHESVHARDMDGSTPLHYAVRGASDDAADTILALIGAGADPNAKDDAGYTPLDVAMQLGIAAYAKILNDNGARCATHTDQLRLRDLLARGRDRQPPG